jgi:hypothetical protein
MANAAEMGIRTDGLWAQESRPAEAFFDDLTEDTMFLPLQIREEQYARVVSTSEFEKTAIIWSADSTYKPSEDEIKEEKKAIQYNWDFDSDKAKELLFLRYLEPELYEQKRQELAGLIDFNLQTMLRERHNAELSRWQVAIFNGQLCDVHKKKPLIAQYEAGRKHRAENPNPKERSSAHDQLREQAEVDTQITVQQVLCDPATKEGTMVVYASPQGGGDSIYKHNFFDSHTLKKDSTGEYYVESVRKSIDGNNFQVAETLAQLQKNYFSSEDFGKVPFDVYCLAHPIVLNNNEDSSITPEKIHELFQKGGKTMPEDMMQEIILLSPSLRWDYIEAVLSNPYDKDRYGIKFNALLNITDEAGEDVRMYSRGAFRQKYSQENMQYTEAEIDFIGRRPVQGMDTGCGYSGGATIGGANGPMSVVEFSVEAGSGTCKDCGRSSSDNHYHCPTELRDAKGRKGCGRFYNDETNKTWRTEVCGCGFQFNCKA